MLVRQLDFDQQHDLGGWKGYYMYRNLFVVHLRYGANALVRLKPWLIALVAALLGIGFMIMLTGALMSLLFLSSGTGHDEAVRDFRDDQAG